MRHGEITTEQPQLHTQSPHHIRPVRQFVMVFSMTHQTHPATEILQHASECGEQGHMRHECEVGRVYLQPMEKQQP